jgi:Zn-dependent peptidase ImmA (M78 family)
MMNDDIDLKIEPSILKALRESSGYSIDDLANYLKIPSDKLLSVENGKLFLNFSQIKKLADIYQRPLVVFFEKSAPELAYIITDYRINRERRLTPNVYLAKRRADYLVNKIAQISGKKSKIPSFPGILKADQLANQFRDYLGVSTLKFKKPKEILDYYKKVLEEKLSISIIEYPFDADDVRAFCISSEISIIALNEKDRPEIKLFSIFHDICHLIKRISGLCSIKLEKENNQEVESYCNLFAAEFLTPKDDLKKQVKDINVFEKSNISKLTRTYGVSKQVIMLRLLLLGYITTEIYNKFKENFDKEVSKKRERGYKNWETVFFNRIGNLALREVNNAYHNEKISFSDVMDILNIKTKYIEKFIEP